MEEKIKTWFRESGEIETPEQLADFARHLFCEEHHTYDSAVHAVSALALAGAWLGAHMEGITGFQAGFVKFDFLREWDRYGRETGCVRILDFDKMLYPQYEKKFDKVMSIEMFRSIQKAAARKLDERGCCWAVREHLGGICNGKVPFGYMVVDDDGNVVQPTPISVNTPMHSLADVERAWQDHTSPFFDKERFVKYIEDNKEINGF